MTRLLAVALALVAVGFGATACGGSDSAASAGTGGAASKHVTVKIGVLRGAGPLNLSQQDGSLDRKLAKLGATIQWVGPFPAFAPAAEAINAGSVDITQGSITSAVGALAGRTSFSIFGRQLADHRAEGIVVRPDSGIKTVADLKGHTVAVNRGGTGEYLLLKALDQAGLRPEDVKRVYLAPIDAGPAFGSGKVDAWATWSSFTVLAQGQYGAKLITDGGKLGSQNDVVYVVRDEFLKAHPAIVAAVFDALRARAEQAKADPDATAKIVAGLQKVPEPVAKSLVAVSDQPPDAIVPAIVRRFQGVADYFSARHVVPQPVSLDGRTVDVSSLR
jgi:sulfonate transport system substrate-binding protein